MQVVQGKVQELNIQGKIQDLNLQGKVQELFNREPASSAEPMNAQSGGVLSAWNSYAARSQPEPAGQGATGRDLESGVSETLAPLLKSANSSIVGAFNSVTKGVRELPANVQSATQFVPSRQALTAFAIMIAAGVFFIFMAFFMFLPIIVLVPQKFAIAFTIGCIFIVGSFFALKGPKAQFFHMISKERLPFTAGFIGSMAATIYVSMVLHSYILSVFFAVIQVLALLYYLLSYFPGGTAGMQFLTSMIVSSITKCFGRS
ncbi:uncharacterized protein [Physcomitrium patens]|uniref:Vesicle transport protein n=1 Tax=Physcomitrium patens TaxID=3218 RepID=A0A2K1IJ86_PHYPA|nr:protein transport protein SFT2-like [Physcomitrium patens]PNR29341.1 hypothetical protein PHYPA_028033 [Physcomitrium patens]|eukprot:XP_024363090.1 protein transport protein SFT2-like [Physcomitrella patens]